MRWESIISIRNLKLAWRRINTARNLQYKRFFREAYLVYESSLNENIRELHKSLSAKVWEPSHATRIYIPKPSGLQRPLSLLDIEDQIVFQAVANQFARKLFTKRQKVELKTVFSNKLTSKTDSIFFTERWQSTYRVFQNECSEAFDEGYTWAADFDLAAYYDTISHDLLLNIASPTNSHAETKEIVSGWLQIWSANDQSAVTRHGIPQGPIASDFLAEAFFLPIDLQLQKRGFRYLRYVDDIRLFGTTENEVRRAAILLEQECRHRGLIPQSAKFEVRELRNVEDAMGALPSISPTVGTSEPQISATKALEILESSIGDRPLKVVDKARFRYVMYRAPADTKFLSRVLLLLPRHPEHVDAFVAYFSNFARRPKIARAVIEYLNTDLPYSYVRGELWHVVARLSSPQELRLGLEVARTDAKDRKNCAALSWGVMHYLMRCDKEKLCRLGNRLSAEQPVSRSLLAPVFPEREFSNTGHIRTILRGSLMEQLAGAREMQKRNLTLKDIGLRQNQLKSTSKNSLRSLGVIKRRSSKADKDWVGETLEKMYSLNTESIWQGLLSTEYEHALQLLIEAKARFHSARSDWLSLQDSFNDLLTRKLFVFLKKNGLPGHSKTVGRNGKLVVYGNLIASGTPFARAYPDIASRFRDIHDRRNSLPGSHPYDLKGGAKNRWLKKAEQDGLVAQQKVAMHEVVSVVFPHISNSNKH